MENAMSAVDWQGLVFEDAANEKFVVFCHVGATFSDGVPPILAEVRIKKVALRRGYGLALVGRQQAPSYFHLLIHGDNGFLRFG